MFESLAFDILDANDMIKVDFKLLKNIKELRTWKIFNSCNYFLDGSLQEAICK
jgi:hypothetical protein